MAKENHAAQYCHMFMAVVPVEVKNKVTAKLVSIADNASVLLIGAENKDFHATRGFFQDHSLEDFLVILCEAKFTDKHHHAIAGTEIKTTFAKLDFTHPCKIEEILHQLFTRFPDHY